MTIKLRESDEQTRRAAAQTGLRVAESFNDQSLKPLLAALASRMAQAGETVTEDALRDTAQKGPDHVRRLIHDFSDAAPGILTYESVCRTLQSRDNQARIFLDPDRVNPQAIAEYSGSKEELLAQAALQSHLPTIKFFHALGIDSPGIYNSAAQIAASRGRVDILEYLHDRSDISKASPEMKGNIIFKALHYGHLPVLKFLHAHGFGFANMNQIISNSKLPALRYLFRKKLISIESHGEEIFSKGLVYGANDIIKFILDKGYKPSDRQLTTTVGVAASQLHLNSIRYLHKRGFNIIDPENLVKSNPGAAQELLRSALQARNFKILRRLYRQGVRPDLANQDTRTALGSAFVSGYMDMLAYMIDRGMDDSMFAKNPNCSAAWGEGMKRWRAWERAGYHELPAKGLHLHTPHGYRHDVFVFAKKILAGEGHDSEQGDELAWQLMRLFGSEQSILQYMQRWGTWDKFGKQVLHDLAVNIRIPDNQTGIDIKAWGDGVLKFGPPMARYFKFADKLPRPCASLAKTRDFVSKFAYARGAENEELASLCIEIAASEKQFEQALDLLKAHADKGFPQKTIPDFRVDGALFGMPGAVFRRLEADDPRALFLGEYTDCCQSVDKTGSDCAIHGFTHPDSGFYVIENEKNEIIGQTWAWTGTNKSLVFDSLERRGSLVSLKSWGCILMECKKQMDNTGKKYKFLMLGTGGRTPQFSTLLPCEGATPVAYKGYRDSHAQFIIWDYRSNRQESTLQPCY